jgi:hypothetical protein
MIKQQTSKDGVWIDEQGTSIPYNRLTKSEKLREGSLYKVATSAAKLNTQLLTLKATMREKVVEIVDAIIAENNGKVRETKGNLVLYNFDGSIKLEVNINDRIEFDSVLLDQCKAKLDQLLNENLSTNESFIKDIVMSAFETGRGKLDTKKVLALKKHSSRIKHPLYTEAMEFLDKSIRRPDSRTYYRVWVKDEQGKYENIDLNFSSI